MGKPFEKELKYIDYVYKWALKVPVEEIDFIKDILHDKSLLVVGSGGSTCSCCLFAMLQQKNGRTANYITPLDLQYVKNSIDKKTNVFFISASGKNTDILFAFDTALKQEPSNIVSICMKRGSLLSNKSSNYSISKTIELDNPVGKDGFLATNSTIAYFTIIARFFDNNRNIETLIPSDEFIEEVRLFSLSLHSDFTVTVLYSGWSKPVALDIESKFSEAGLGNVLLTDYRNFGHGRHNWLDKKKKQSAIVALITKEDEALANMTLNLIPREIPVLRIISEYSESNASLDLLSKSFYLVNQVGKIKGIDPGKPGVPPYGSKLYHLKYSKTFLKKDVLNSKVKNAIRRKFGDTDNISNEIFLPLWIKSYNTFVSSIKKTKFKGVLLDYDGTLCSTEERYLNPRKEIINKLEFFLNNGITVGVVTGRGKSVRETLQKVINVKYWDKFYIGYYNGAQIGTLNDNLLPIKDNDQMLFNDIERVLKNEELISQFVDLELRKGQLTVIVKENKNSHIVKSIMKDILIRLYPNEIQILESSHSIDIISTFTTKNSIIKYIRMVLNDKEEEFSFLSIGDRGKWPGNDFQLLSNRFSLSVDEVSSDPHTCWNLSSLGNNCVETTLEYFDAFHVLDYGFFKMKI